MNHPFRIITGSKGDSYSQSKSNSLAASIEADAIQMKPLQPDWKRIVSDLELYGQLKITTSNSAASLCYNAVFDKVIDDGKCCLIEGQGFQLTCDQSPLMHATLVKNNNDNCYKSLRFLDFSRNEQLRFDLTEKSHIDRFYCTLIKHWSKPNALKSILEYNSVCCLQKTEQLLGSKNIDVQTYKCAQYYSSLDGEDINPINIIPLLEMLVDQYGKFHIWVGNKSVQTRYEHQFFDFEHSVDKVRLRSQKASLDLDFSKIAKSKVCGCPEVSGKKNVLLYDSDDLCIASLGISQNTLTKNKAIWTKILKELTY